MRGHSVIRERLCFVVPLFSPSCSGPSVLCLFLFPPIQNTVLLGERGVGGTMGVSAAKRVAAGGPSQDAARPRVVCVEPDAGCGVDCAGGDLLQACAAPPSTPWVWGCKGGARSLRARRRSWLMCPPSISSTLPELSSPPTWPTWRRARWHCHR